MHQAPLMPWGKFISQSFGRAVLTAVALAASAPAAWATAPSADELKDATSWTEEHLAQNGPKLPFSCVYGGHPLADLLSSWPRQVARHVLEDRRVETTSTWTDPATGLQVRSVAVAYPDFPVVEWTVYFRNTGPRRTPMIDDIRALDINLEREKGPQSVREQTDALSRRGVEPSLREFVVHHLRGDVFSPESYAPASELLVPNSTLRLSPVGGRPTDSGFPYYNLQMPGRGVIIALGWPGQWRATFERDARYRLHITAGQAVTHLYLNPAEEIRSPLVALMFYRGDDITRAQNSWRRWMVARNLPRLGGRLPAPMWSVSDTGSYPGMKSTEAGEHRSLAVVGREAKAVDYWWIDAGWYNTEDAVPGDSTWHRTGTWEPDPVRYPHGLRPVSDDAHARGMKFILWFEPERVTADTWLARQHPEWLLGDNPRGRRLLDLGNPRARQWLVAHVDTMIREQGIDVYRNDFNMEPLSYWQKQDAPDRQGITENFYVQGFLGYLDELRRRNPQLLIDTCASGGRRLDLETMRRSVPLYRSDYVQVGYDAQSQQNFTLGLAAWLPYFGTGAEMPKDDTTYFVRSLYGPALNLSPDLRNPDVDWTLYRQLASQWREVAPLLLADFYPLTPYTTRSDRWVAWQFNRPETGDGMIQAFRRAGSDATSTRLHWHGLDADAAYRVRNLDDGSVTVHSGQELQQGGLAVEISSRPGSAILTYSRLKQGDTP